MVQVFLLPDGITALVQPTADALKAAAEGKLAKAEDGVKSSAPSVSRESKGQQRPEEHLWLVRVKFEPAPAAAEKTTAAGIKPGAPAQGVTAKS